jgi:hypothetical protein
MEKRFDGKQSAAIFLAHINPLTLSHEKIIKSLLENYKVYIFPVRFLKNEIEVNTRSFPFSFNIRKQMILESFNYNKDIVILDKYTFISPYLRYFPPFISLSFQKLKKDIVSSIQESSFITYTGDRAERLLLKLFGFNPIQANRQIISSTNVKNLLYESALSCKALSQSTDIDTQWNNYVSPKVSNIIRDNWNTIDHFSSSDDETVRVLGMKFPRDGFI